MSWNCQICQKVMDANGPNTDTNYNVSYYHGKKPETPPEAFIMCETCFKTKEQEYLNNYRRIWKETEKEGLIWIKENKKDCYAGKKDQNGKILQQQNCSHCQPWKFADDNDNNKDKPTAKKCFVCGKDITNQQELTYSSKDSSGRKKDYCSIKCLKRKIRNNPQQPNPPPNLQNNNKEMSTGVKIFIGISITFLVFIIGLIGAQIYKKRSRQKTS